MLTFYDAQYLALAHLLANQPDSAAYFLTIGIADINRQKAYPYLSTISQVQALYEIRLGHLAQAEAALNRSWQLIHQYNLPANTSFGITAPDYYLALVRIKQNRLTEAIHLLKQDIQRLIYQRPDKLRDYKLLAELYEKAGQTQQATQSYKQFIALQDSLLADQAEYRSISFEAEQQMNQKDLSITKLQSDNKIASLSRNFTLGLAVLLLLLVAPCTTGLNQNSGPMRY